MQDYKITIRFATLSDSKSTFEWRNDELSRAMFFNNSALTIEEHTRWFNGSLRNMRRCLYIGEVGDKKIGLCRFDLNKDKASAEISLNMNPEMRGQGLGKRFLFMCAESYLENTNVDLVAKVKAQNYASIKVFESAGFRVLEESSGIVVLTRSLNRLAIKEVDDADAATLFGLLEKRNHSISHNTLPSKNEHLEFVNSKPYRYWALVHNQEYLVGSFYIQNDNSIGLNILQPDKASVSEILRKIKAEFTPSKEVKSKIPGYFYINVAHSNEDLKMILGELGLAPIQISYKLR